VYSEANATGKWLDFVVPDASLAAASEVLANGRFSQPLLACPDSTDCLDGSSPMRQHPHTAFHMHIEGVENHRSVSSVCLHRQSETLGFLPPLDASLASPRAGRLPPYLALACDKTAVPPYVVGHGRGRFHSDQTVVLVPKAHILTEALMRIMARDAGTMVGANSVQHFCYIGLYVYKQGFLDLDLLPRPFREVYGKFSKGSKPLRDNLAKLRRAMGLPSVDNAVGHR
jgi:hypothetical protein